MSSRETVLSDGMIVLLTQLVAYENTSWFSSIILRQRSSSSKHTSTFNCVPLAKMQDHRITATTWSGYKLHITIFNYCTMLKANCTLASNKYKSFQVHTFSSF